MAEQTSHMVKLEEAGIKVYKVRAWMDRLKRGGKSEREHNFEEVIIGNEESARYLYKEQKQRLNSYAYMAGYSGKVELIEPHIFENGTIAYWGATLEEHSI